jgi:hypothetical protein
MGRCLCELRSSRLFLATSLTGGSRSHLMHL